MSPCITLLCQSGISHSASIEHFEAQGCQITRGDRRSRFEELRRHWNPDTLVMDVRALGNPSAEETRKHQRGPSRFPTSLLIHPSLRHGGEGGIRE